MAFGTYQILNKNKPFPDIRPCAKIIFLNWKPTINFSWPISCKIMYKVTWLNANSTHNDLAFRL